MTSFTQRKRAVPSIRSTYVIKTMNDDIHVVYHNTSVVIAHPDGTFTLHSGNFRTSTTKSRINEFSPARLYQRNFQWFIADNRPFRDGIHIDANGNEAFLVNFASARPALLIQSDEDSID